MFHFRFIYQLDEKAITKSKSTKKVTLDLENLELQFIQKIQKKNMFKKSSKSLDLI